ncbi:DUF2975 domain-containing protein [uncultured Bacteroides sp.]|uniref:DUF2975 domain-containing protein n=1 Tax=uncultured Bacteroides sp. TaxID=162156 RepID=UPI00262D61E1|nr:DUF2975 domain-containing protein [uncultured Bacteroides sp.]
MKKKLNLIILGIVFSIILSTSFVFVLFWHGFKAGFNQPEMYSEKNHINYEMVATIPINFGSPSTATAINQKDGKTIHLTPLISMVEVQEDSIPASASLFKTILIFLSAIVSIYVIVQFVKFIRNIYKNIIFDWKNVKVLRKLGWGLVIVFLAGIIEAYITQYYVFGQIALKDCIFSISHYLTESELILGFTSLLFAEIFAIGLRLKEENDMTI